MKTNITTTPAAFAPVSITITLETKKELDAFAAAMNTSCITESVEKLGEMPRYTLSNQIAEPLRKLGANIDDVIKLRDFVKKAL